MQVLGVLTHACTSSFSFCVPQATLILSSTAGGETERAVWTPTSQKCNRKKMGGKKKSGLLLS